MRKIILSIIISFNVAFCKADDTIFISNKSDFYDISLHSEFYVDKTMNVKIFDFFDNPEKFIFSAVNNSNPNFGNLKEIVWLKFILKNQADSITDWYLNVNYSTLNKIELYFIKNNQLYDTRYSGIDYMYNKAELNFREPVFNIVLKNNEEICFFMKIETFSNKIIPISLSTHSRFIEKKQSQSLIIVILFGILIAAFLYNFILFLITREKMYLFFSLSMFFILIFYGFFHGYFFEYDFKIPVKLRTSLKYLGYSIGSIFLLKFTQLYLDTEKIFKTGHIILKFAIIYLIINTIFIFLPFDTYYLINKFNAATYPFFAVIQIFIGIVTLTKKQKHAIYFVVSYSFFIIGTFMHSLFIFDVIQHNFYLKHISIINMSVFAILLSAGLSERVTNVRKEMSRVKQLNIDKTRLQAEIAVRKKIEAELNEHKLNLEKIVEQRTKELSENEKKYRELVEQLHDWVWQVNEDGLFTFSSISAEKITGLPTEAILNKHFNQIFPSERADEIYKMAVSLERRKEGFKDYETFLYSNSGEQIYVKMNGKPFFDENGIFKGYRGVISDISEKKNIERKILKAMLETEENERKRFATELHDGLGATLSGINMYMNTINSENLDENIKNDLLIKVQELVKYVAAETRAIANNLRPFELSYLGLNKSIENLCQKIVIPNKIEIKLNLNQLTVKLKDDYELIIYRVISELINNSLKHARPSCITIEMFNINKKLFITYCDDGRGFDFEKSLNSKSGMGLQNIVTRINSIKGIINVTSEFGKGTIIKIEIDLK